jgi:Ca-activated chloride channel homolog
MPGRHASRARSRRRRWPQRLAVFTVVLAAIGGGAYAGRDYIPDAVDRFLGNACEGSIPVEIIASPDIAPTLTAIVEDENADEVPNVAGRCIDATITPMSSGEAAAAIEGGTDADLWVPDSSMWLDRVTGDQIEPEGHASLATSPLVAAVSRPMAEAMGWPDADFSWQAALSGDADAAIIDPASSTAGFATLMAAFTAVSGEDGQPDRTQLVGALTAVAQNVAPTADEAFGWIADSPGDAPIFTTIEQSVVAYNQRTSSTSVVALYPDEGTVIFDYPAVPVITASSTAEARAAVNTLLDLFAGDPAVERLQARGFRAPDGSAAPRAGIGDGIDPLMPGTLPTPPSEVGRDILRQWSALSLEMRMLAVIDVSGSMVATDGGEASRAELVRDAAQTALGLFPQNGSVGLWIFSTFEDEENDRHWRELAPIAPLNEDIGDGVTQVERLFAATDQIPDIVEANAPEPLKGWTALYDTTFAAFETVKGNYEPGKVNSIVLMTDGEDEWPAGFGPDIDRETLLQNLEANDPAQPVPIIAIGIGPEADMDALRAIAAATGGSAHLALDPSEIQDVFLQAMVDRQCRPNC